MPKRVLYTCAWCGRYIYHGEMSKVRSTKNKTEHYHYTPGVIDCLKDEDRAIKTMREMDEAGLQVAHGYE